MANIQQTARSRRKNSYSALSWCLQVGAIAFICLGLASEGLATHRVRVSQTSLTYHAVQGATNPPSQTITVSRPYSSRATLRASDNVRWLSVSPRRTSMTSSKNLTVAVNTSGRGAGTYTATVTIRVGTWYTKKVPVTLIISPSTTPPPTSPPSTPPPSTSSATLTWNAITGTPVSGYKVYIGEAPRLYTQTINVGTVTSSTVNNLTVGRTYYFAVSAYNSAGEGPPSDEVTKTIQSP